MQLIRSAGAQANISVVGIPKTIDNDIGLIDRSFGFNTAVEVGLPCAHCSDRVQCVEIPTLTCDAVVP